MYIYIYVYTLYKIIDFNFVSEINLMDLIFILIVSTYKYTFNI